MVNLVAVQLVSGTDIEQNLFDVETLLSSLPQGQPTVVVLPECFIHFGGSDRQLLELSKQATDLDLVGRLSKLAKRFQIWLVAGTVPLPAVEKDKFTASCLVLDPFGDVIAEYQKIHLFDVDVADNTGQYRESNYTQPGNELVVVETPFARIGVAVCYDLRFASMFQAMQRPEIIVLPSAFTQKTGEAHWHPLLRARAIENQCYFIAANQGGEHDNGRQTYGHSCIISPWGEIKAELPTGSGVVTASYDPEEIERIRQQMPVGQHDKFRSTLVKSG